MFWAAPLQFGLDRAVGSDGQCPLAPLLDAGGDAREGLLVPTDHGHRGAIGGQCAGGGGADPA
jgi:hypothetical protein